jgi:hypothetical protein
MNVARLAEALYPSRPVRSSRHAQPLTRPHREHTHPPRAALRCARAAARASRVTLGAALGEQAAQGERAASRSTPRRPPARPRTHSHPLP